MEITNNVHVDRAINEIDAALFSGDVFNDKDTIVAMANYLSRWGRKLKETESELEN